MSEETTEVAPEVSEATKTNIANVGRLNDLIVDNKDNDNLETFDKILSLINDVKVRDGFLHVFAHSPWQERNKTIDTANSYLITIGNRDDSISIPKVKIGNFTSFIAALVYVHAGANHHEEHNNPELIPLVDGLLKSAEDFQTDWTFFQLMKRARQFSVPTHVLYDSIAALSFNDCVEA